MSISRALISLGVALTSALTTTLVWVAPGAAPGPGAAAPDAHAQATTQATTQATPRPASLVAAAQGRNVVVLFGDVRRPQLLTRQRLASLDQRTVTTTFVARGTPTTRTYTGPLLLDVVASARPRFDESRNNDQLAFALRVGATDGYRAVIAYGEIDPNFANTEVLLALTENGVRLDRPRLVVPGDARGGRYVTDVSSVGVIDLGR